MQKRTYYVYVRNTHTQQTERVEASDRINGSAESSARRVRLAKGVSHGGLVARRAVRQARERGEILRCFAPLYVCPGVREGP